MTRNRVAKRLLAYEPLEGADLTNQSDLLYAYREMGQNVMRPAAVAILSRYLSRDVASTDSLTICWIARFKELGCILSGETEAYFTRMLTSVTYKEAARPVSTASLPAVQKRSNGSQNDLVADLDSLVDKAELVPEGNIVAMIAKAPLKDKKVAQEKYADILDELTAKNLDVIYSDKAKKELPVTIKLLTRIKAAFMINQENKKKVRKPRKVNKAKVIQKALKAATAVPFLKNLNGFDGLTPDKIVGKSVLWTYDTYRERIRVYYAKEGGFTLRRTMIENILSSKQKRTKKPSLFMAKQTPAAMVKLFDGLKVMQEEASNRLNDRTIIIRVM